MRLSKIVKTWLHNGWLGTNAPRRSMQNGPMNGDAFAGFCKEILAPTLEPDQIVVLDNLSSHKRTDAIEGIERAGGRRDFLAAVLSRFESDREHLLKGETIDSQRPPTVMERGHHLTVDRKMGDRKMNEIPIFLSSIFLSFF